MEPCRSVSVFPSMNKKDAYFGSSDDRSKGSPSARPAADLKGAGPVRAQTRAPRFRPVFTPRPYEAVGRALSTAYSAVGQNSLPDDMLSLLRQLDEVPARSDGKCG